MKLILLVAIIGFSSSSAYLADTDYGEELLALTKIWHNKCAPITGVTQASIDQMRNGTFVDEAKIKRYTLCLWLVSDVMKPDYTLNISSLKELMPKKMAKGLDIYLGCFKTAEESNIADPCDRIWGMMQCLYHADPEEFVMF